MQSRFSAQCQCNVCDMHFHRYEIIKISWHFFFPGELQFDKRGYGSRAFCDHDNLTNTPCRPRLSYIRDISKLRFVRNIVTTFFIPASHANGRKPAGANTRAFYVETRSRHFALTSGKSKRQRCVYTAATRVQRAHPRTHSRPPRPYRPTQRRAYVRARAATAAASSIHAYTRSQTDSRLESNILK